MLKVFTLNQSVVKSYRLEDEIDWSRELNGSSQTLHIHLKSETENLLKVEFGSNQFKQYAARFAEIFNGSRADFVSKSSKTPAKSSVVTTASYSTSFHLTPTSSKAPPAMQNTPKTNKNYQQNGSWKSSRLDISNGYSEESESTQGSFSKYGDYGKNGSNGKSYLITPVSNKATCTVSSNKGRDSVSSSSSTSTSKCSSPASIHETNSTKTAGNQSGTTPLNKNVQAAAKPANTPLYKLPDEKGSENSYATTPTTSKPTEQAVSSVQKERFLPRPPNRSSFPLMRGAPLDQRKMEAMHVKPGWSNRNLIQEFQKKTNNPEEDKYPYKEYSSRSSNRYLPNTGNSCYINSVLQALTSCSYFVSRCDQLNFLEKEGNIFSRLADHIGTRGLTAKRLFVEKFLVIVHEITKCVKDKYWNREKPLREFRESLGEVDSIFRNNKQQDAHDFLMQVFHCFDDLMTVKGLDARRDWRMVQGIKLNPNLVVRFKTEQSLVCTHCKKENLNESTQEMLQIPMHSESDLKLSDLLDTMFQGYSVERRCSCDGPTAYARDRIATFPQCLIMNLQRYRTINLKSQKIESLIHVPLEIDVSKYHRHAPLEYDANKNLIVHPAKYESGPLTSLLGGARDPHAIDDDDECQVLKEEIKFNFHFKLITNLREVKKMLDTLRVHVDEEMLKKHLTKLCEQPSSDMKKQDAPGIRKRIKEDGNCFFRAISWCLTGNQDHHERIREAVVKYLMKSKDIMERFCPEPYEKHIEGIREGDWATECEIAAVANMLGVNVYTHLSNGWVCQPPKESVSKSIGSLYLRNPGEHYEPVISLEQSSARTDRTPRKKNPDVEDDGGDWTPTSNKRRRIAQTFSLKPSSSSRPNPRRSCRTSKPSEPSEEPYSLVAAVCHEGSSLSSGHYYAYIKDMYSDPTTWYMSSDLRFDEASEEVMLNVIASEAYILFYERKSVA